MNTLLSSGFERKFLLIATAGDIADQLATLRSERSLDKEIDHTPVLVYPEHAYGGIDLSLNEFRAADVHRLAVWKLGGVRVGRCSWCG